MKTATATAAISSLLLFAAQQAPAVQASPLFFEGATRFLANQPVTESATASSSAAASASSAPSIAPAGAANSNTGFTGHTQIYRTCAQSGTFAITFDDGVQPNQPAFRNLLDQANAKGTFFVNGNNYRCIYDPDMVSALRATYAAGHEIANHGWGHDHSSQLTPEEFNNQVRWVEEALVKILGVLPNMFRFPYGDYADFNVDVLSSRNYTAAVGWDSISGPGTGTSVDQSNAWYRGMAQSYPSPHITLNHEQDTVAITQIIPQAIRSLQAAGYRLVTVSECLGIPAYQRVGEPQQRDATWTCSDKPMPGAPHKRRSCDH